jgi:cation transport ATPase
MRSISLSGLPQWRDSPHFLAHEIVREARTKGGRVHEASDIEAFEGLGIRGHVLGVETSIGNRRLMERSGLSLVPAMDRRAESQEKRGKTVSFFGWEGSVRGFLVFGDPVRPGAEEVVRLLHARGMEVWLVSGDGVATTERVARSLGIVRSKGQALPAEKAELIRRLQHEGHRVGMVGDGLNDAGALAQADVGCAFGPAMQAVRGASDLTFLSPDPGKLIDAFELSRLTTRRIRQNLFFAFLYNAVAIPVAAAGLLNPLVAVCAMFASSLMVTGSALRMSGTAQTRQTAI